MCDYMASSFFKDGCPTKSILYEDVKGLAFSISKVLPNITGLDDHKKLWIPTFTGQQ